VNPGPPLAPFEKEGLGPPWVKKPLGENIEGPSKRLEILEMGKPQKGNPCLK